VVTATTLLLKYDTRVHNWAFREYLWEVELFSQTSYSGYYSEKMPLILPKLLYGMTPAEKLMPNSIPEKPWTHISVDLITKLPLAQGYDSILVVVDRLTKIVYFIPTTERTSAEELAQLFRDNV